MVAKESQEWHFSEASWSPHYRCKLLMNSGVARIFPEGGQLGASLVRGGRPKIGNITDETRESR